MLPRPLPLALGGDGCKAAALLPRLGVKLPFALPLPILPPDSSSRSYAIASTSDSFESMDALLSSLSTDDLLI